LNDPEPDVRRTAAWLTGLFEDADARKELCSMVEHDTDPGCRRQAIKALLKLPAPDKCSVTFREALRDPEVSVVTAAAEAVGLIRDRRSVGILQLLASNGNIYLHRAAGKALIRIGDKSGFPVLIDTLSYPCEDHSSQHQITTLVDFLASFAGVHFGFDQSAWKDWWSRSEMDLNLEKNIEARRAYLKIVKKADKMMPSSLAQALERLRRTFPDYAGYDRALADIVCDRAHTLLKQKPTLALRLARLAYNMNPDLSRRIVLINALAASGDTDGALEHINIALENNPSNETLRQLRNQLMKRSQAHR
jgi:tetratricopeptide (TPR) repeat protein